MLFRSLKTNPPRAAQHDRLAPVVDKIVKARTFADLAEVMERLKIPFAPLAKPSDLFDDPHLNQGGHMLDMHFLNGKRANIPGLPLEMGEHDLSIRMQPPRKGEHTRDVLADLGFGATEIDAWVEQGVVILPE